ncbi:PREDICTED: dual specificity protein phosphatase 18 [Charadrius vociferus]|uniref:dual specificity protein phosphatase 18 n=1 Tax=Charadrius vociferus TaxID=50402 RepID=UPI00052182BC|nr:PREDICTED: dual specificity protein phosphatase 18 [Charadrius vociferus]
MAPVPPALVCVVAVAMVATNSHLLLITHRISTIINVSLEVVNTLCPTVEYLHVPVMDAAATHISSCFNSMAAKIHSVGTHRGPALLHCTAGVSRSPPSAWPISGSTTPRPWVKSCRRIVEPNNGFWQQLIHYEYKLRRQQAPNDQLSVRNETQCL